MAPDTASTPVSSRRTGSVLVASIDSPPVNTLGVNVRRGFGTAIDAAQSDNAVDAVQIVGAGRQFIVGADIRGSPVPAGHERGQARPSPNATGDARNCPTAPRRA